MERHLRDKYNLMIQTRYGLSQFHSSAKGASFQNFRPNQARFIEVLLGQHGTSLPASMLKLLSTAVLPQ